MAEDVGHIKSKDKELVWKLLQEVTGMVINNKILEMFRIGRKVGDSSIQDLFGSALKTYYQELGPGQEQQIDRERTLQESNPESRPFLGRQRWMQRVFHREKI